MKLDIGGQIQKTEFGSLIDPTIYNIPKFIALTIQLILATSAVVAFVLLLWGCLQWVLAGGDKEGLEKAKKRITGSMIGLAFVMSVYAIAGLSQIILGINILGNIAIPTF